MKTVAITGSSGFVGTNLKKAFEKKGFNVIGIKRDILKDSKKLTSIIERTDLLINLAGANIINRWTDTYKEKLFKSRIHTTEALIDAISKADKKPSLFISTSAIGIYKNHSCHTEESYDYKDDFLANLCKRWEIEALKAESLKVRTVVFRFGIVLGEGGALEKMLTPFNFGLGGTIGDGTQNFSYIHIDDLINAYEFVYENKNCHGIYNLTAPTPTTNYTFTKVLGKILKRPTILPIPKFILKLIFSEGAKVLTDGQCVKPKRLLDTGFIFNFKTIESAIVNLVERR